MNDPDERDNELRRLWAKAGEDQFVCSTCLSIQDSSILCANSEDWVCHNCCGCSKCSACNNYFATEPMTVKGHYLLCPECLKWGEDMIKEKEEVSQ